MKKTTEKVKRALDSGPRDLGSSHSSFINWLYDLGQGVPHLRASNSSFQKSLLEHSLSTGEIEIG